MNTDGISKSITVLILINDYLESFNFAMEFHSRGLKALLGGEGITANDVAIRIAPQLVIIEDTFLKRIGLSFVMECRRIAIDEKVTCPKFAVLSSYEPLERFFHLIDLRKCVDLVLSKSIAPRRIADSICRYSTAHLESSESFDEDLHRWVAARDDLMARRLLNGRLSWSEEASLREIGSHCVKLIEKASVHREEPDSDRFWFPALHVK